MGRNKKKTEAKHDEPESSDTESDHSSGEAEAKPVDAPSQQQPSAANTSAASAGLTKWVEVAKSDKKKPTTILRGLAQYGLKLPAVAASLKKMVAPTEVVKGGGAGDDYLELQGDVTTQLTDTLVAKFSIPKEAITNDAAVSAAQEAKAHAKAEGGAAAAELSDDEDDDVVITKLEPISVSYCPICSFPAEMCEYSGMFDKCKPWLMEQLAAEEAAALADAEEKGRKRRPLTEHEKLDNLLAGKGKKKIQQVITLDCKTRSGKKRVTIITGLDLFGLNMSDVSRDFKKMFSCGAGIVEEPGQLPAVEVQGDIVSQLCDLLPTKYKIPKEAIFYMDGKTKVQAHPPAGPDA